MAESKPRVFLAGARLVWRQQQALWLLYAANLLLAFTGVRGAILRVEPILNHSLASGRLVHGFDMGAYLELLLHPSVPFSGSRPPMIYNAVLFAAFMLFITGGLLTAYYEDRPLSPASFFAACGDCFWRLLRLMVYFTVVLVSVGILVAFVQALFRRIDRDSISPFPAMFFLAAAVAVIAALLLSARLWFDLAELLVVANGGDNMRHVLKTAGNLLRRDFLRLFWLYLRITVVGWVGVLLGLHIWMRYLRPEATIQGFLVSQLTIAFILATRLWQRASSAVWFREHEPQLNVLANPPQPLAPSVAPAEVVPG